ncbi:MAG: Holliday junction resolvase RuvX [Candidatus Glassbacteria bacterium]|nr:Holliday junction resolvase RuvX [Candidatus Glassbacteria bacterium]
MGRIMGVDYGERRLGLAVSDPSGRLAANALPTLDRRKLKGGPEEAVARLAEEWEVEEIVVGLPVNMDGSQGPAARKVEEFAARLAGLSGLPVSTWDERLTTVVAQRVQADLNLPRAKRREKGRLDRTAALLLLQNYLDFRNRHQRDSRAGGQGSAV